MSKVWEDLLASLDAPYDIALGAEEGDVLLAAPPYPDLTIDDAHVSEVKSLFYQTVFVTATMAESDRSRRMLIGRLMAVTTEGAEIEIHREVLPAEALETGVDITTCGACGGNIPHGEAVVLESGAYHPSCLSEG